MSSKAYANVAEEAWIHYIAEIPAVQFLLRLFSIAFINLGFSSFYPRPATQKEEVERLKNNRVILNAPQKTAIITGGNSGIGYEVALELCSIGYRVIIGCRDQIKAFNAINSIKARLGKECSVEYLHLDLSSFSSVKIFASAFISRETRLDLLINNAAVCAPAKFIRTENNIEQQYQVNYLSHFLLTRLLVPCLVATPNSRVINLTSCLSFATSGDFDFKLATDDSYYEPLKNYCLSKTAIILSALSFKEKLSPFGILNFAVHPGFVSSSHYKECGSLNSISTFLNRQKIRLPSQGITTIMFLALTPSKELANYSKSFYFSDGMPMLPVQKHCSEALREELWNDSCRKVGLNVDI